MLDHLTDDEFIRWVKDMYEDEAGAVISELIVRLEASNELDKTLNKVEYDNEVEAVAGDPSCT